MEGKVYHVLNNLEITYLRVNLSQMNWSLIAGIVFLIIGLLMLNYIRKQKPASDKNNWKGQWISQYIHFWFTAVMATILGLAFILQSL